MGWPAPPPEQLVHHLLHCHAGSHQWVSAGFHGNKGTFLARSPGHQVAVGVNLWFPPLFQSLSSYSTSFLHPSPSSQTEEPSFLLPVSQFGT